MLFYKKFFFEGLTVKFSYWELPAGTDLSLSPWDM